MEKIRLNDKQKKFCEEYVKCKYKADEAYRRVYGDIEWVKSHASRLLENKHVRNYIEVVEGSFSFIGKKLWLDKEYVVKGLVEAMVATKKIFNKRWEFCAESPDWNTRLRAYKEYLELCWYKKNDEPLIDEPLDEENDDSPIEILSTEERQKLKEEILKTL